MKLPMGLKLEFADIVLIETFYNEEELSSFLENGFREIPVKRYKWDILTNYEVSMPNFKVSNGRDCYRMFTKEGKTFLVLTNLREQSYMYRLSNKIEKEFYSKGQELAKEWKETYKFLPKDFIFRWDVSGSDSDTYESKEYVLVVKGGKVVNSGNREFENFQGDKGRGCSGFISDQGEIPEVEEQDMLEIYGGSEYIIKGGKLHKFLIDNGIPETISMPCYGGSTTHTIYR